MANEPIPARDQIIEQDAARAAGGGHAFNEACQRGEAETDLPLLSGKPE